VESDLRKVTKNWALLYGNRQYRHKSIGSGPIKDIGKNTMCVEAGKPKNRLRTKINGIDPPRKATSP
jgi:hypothetical protein